MSGNNKEALHLFERAIDKESIGLMSDAVALYRRAFKLNDKVDLLYRTHKIPKYNQGVDKENEKGYLDEEKVRSMDVTSLVESFAAMELAQEDSERTESLDSSEEIDHAEVQPEVSPLMKLPRDLWTFILELSLENSIESWLNFSLTCKRNCYWGIGTKNVWRRLCHLVYTKQEYKENRLYLENASLGEREHMSLPIPLEQYEILPQYENSWRYMLQHRPYIKFYGCYISVVNYYIDAGRMESSNSWSTPVKSVTYYRYLRFYPQGDCYMVLSKLNPSQVVPFLSKNNMAHGLKDISEDPSKHIPHQVNESHRIYKGRWTISIEGEVHVQIANGSVPYYNFHYYFQIKSLSGVFRHNKLNWLSYYGIRKKMSDNDDREGERVDFNLKNETSFKFSRVKSYTTDT